MKYEDPLVVLVGRMNVGKSSLFNRFSDFVKSIVYDQPGVTRDFIKGTVVWQGIQWTLVDTAGFSFQKLEKNVFPDLIQQKLIGITTEASLVIMVVDGTVGLLHEDREIARRLHDMKKRVIVAVNKIDVSDTMLYQHEFSALGFSDIVHISAQHGTGGGDLLQKIVDHLGSVQGKRAVHDPAYKVLFLGKPNVGKSSLMNALLKEDRLLVSPIAGTTREAISEPIKFCQEELLLIDTPGIRRKRSIDIELEKLMVQSSIQALKETDVVLILIDGTEGIMVDQELKLAFYAFTELYKALILVINKTDVMTEENESTLNTELGYYAHLISKIRILKVSCITGKNVGKILPLVKKTWDTYQQSIPDHEINHLLTSKLRERPLRKNGKPLHVIRAFQLHKAPFTIGLQVNIPELFSESQLAFFENVLRKEYNFIGTPIKFVVKKSFASL